MKPQAIVDVDGAHSPIISELKYVEDQPFYPQEKARSRGGTRREPRACGSLWKWGPVKTTACDDGVSLRSGCSFEVPFAPSYRRFSGVTLHKATGGPEGLGTSKSKDVPTKQHTSTVKSPKVEEDARHSKVAKDPQVDAPPEKRIGSRQKAVISNFSAKCAEEIWSRETAFLLREEAEAAKKKRAVWWKSALYSEKNYLKFLPQLSRVFALDSSTPPERSNSVVYHIVVVYNELFLGIFLQSTLLCIFLLFDVLTPTRFYIATRLQLFNTAVGIIPFIYGAFQLPETFVANIASIVCIITISAAGMVGAYPMEVRRRGLFYEWLKAAGSSSALDDIRSNCIEVGSILAALQKGAGEPDVSAGISQALTLTQECLFIFSTCKNLYLTNVNDELKDEYHYANRMIATERAAMLLSVVGLDIGFNPLEFDRTYGDGTASILLDAGTALLSRVASDWGCDEVVLRNFLVQIDKLYQKQPYHNAKHGTLVDPHGFGLDVLGTQNPGGKATECPL
ncbi:hypothetical protein ACSSS7_003720 [Eimeria intestinalis]